MPPAPSRLRRLALAALACASLVAIGCAGDDDDAAPAPDTTSVAGTATPEETWASPTPSATPTPGPSPTPVPPSGTPGLHPPDLETRDEGLNAVVRAIVTRNVESLVELAELTEVECTTDAREVATRPRCPAGAEAGTPVAVLRDATCPGQFVPAQNLRPVMSELLGLEQPYVHSIFIAEAGTRPTYGVVIGPEQPHAVLVREGRIVGLRLNCGDPNRPLVPPIPADAEFLVPPLGLHPEGTTTGIEAVDAVIAAMDVGDAEALVGLVRYSMVACVAEPEGIGSPPVCTEDEEPGTEVAVLPGSVCEGYYWRPEGAEAQMRALTEDWRGLYAVVENLVPTDDGVEAHGHIVTFAASLYTPLPLNLVVNDGGIVAVHWDCGGGLAGLDSEAMVLPPVES